MASVLTELEKLEHLRRLDLPVDLFADVPPKILQGYRLRAATEPHARCVCTLRPFAIP